MARVAGTYSDWALIPNPGFAGKTPRILEAECHDRTPFVSINCRCGAEMHLHEGQTGGAPAEAEVACTCKGCGELLVFPPGWFVEAFASMRAEGWIR